MASHKGHLECVKELLNKGAQVDMQQKVSVFLGCTICLFNGSCVTCCIGTLYTFELIQFPMRKVINIMPIIAATLSG